MLLPNCQVVVADGLQLERVGGELEYVITVRAVGDAPPRRFTGEAAARLESVRQRGGTTEVADDAVTSALVDAGVLRFRAPSAAAERDRLSRRRALELVGGATGVGISTLFLPTAATAASVAGGGRDGVGEPGLLTVSVYNGSDASNRQFSVYWAWTGATPPTSSYSYTIDPGITRVDSSVTSSGSGPFNAGLTFSYPIASNSGSRTVTVTWFDVTKTATITNITVVGNITA